MLVFLVLVDSCYCFCHILLLPQVDCCHFVTVDFLVAASWWLLLLSLMLFLCATGWLLMLLVAASWLLLLCHMLLSFCCYLNFAAFFLPLACCCFCHCCCFLFLMSSDVAIVGHCQLPVATFVTNCFFAFVTIAFLFDTITQVNCCAIASKAPLERLPSQQKRHWHKKDQPSCRQLMHRWIFVSHSQSVNFYTSF